MSTVTGTVLERTGDSQRSQGSSFSPSTAAFIATVMLALAAFITPTSNLFYGLLVAITVVFGMGLFMNREETTWSSLGKRGA